MSACLDSHLRPRRNRGRMLAALAGVVVLLVSLPLVADTPQRPGRAVVIPISGEISDIMKGSIDRRLNLARRDGAKTVIFEMNTPGGLVTSALDICRTIKKLGDEDIRTVAWVNDDAYSAGAMISVACNQILMSSTSHIGDCAPIMIVPGAGLQEMAPAERAKAESPVLAEFRESAVRNDYDQLLLRSMVTVGQEVWWVENVQTGERRFVDADGKTELLGDKPLFGDEKNGGEWRLVATYHDSLSGKDVPAKQPVDSANELLTIDQREAVAYGLATGIARDLDAVTELLGLSSPPTYLEITGWEKFVMWLNSPLVRGILFVIVLLGAYIEFQSPGLILPGAAAGVALVIFLAAPYAAGLADVWTFVLLGLGIVLLAIELFIIPGFGIVGLLGIVLILISFIGTFVPTEPVPDDGGPWWRFAWPSLPGTWDAIKIGIMSLSGSVIVAFVGILLILRYLPQLSIGRHLIPANPQAATVGLAHAELSVALVGEIGVVTGDLRPAGQARFGQEIVDVVSQGEYVEAGKHVQVLRHEGMNVVVRVLPNTGTA